MQSSSAGQVSISPTSTPGGQASNIDWSPRWEPVYNDWITAQIQIEGRVESFLQEGSKTYRNLPDYDPPDLPGWLVHLPEADGSTTAAMVFARMVPNPGDKLALRTIWHPEYVVVTAIVMLPIRRIPRGVVLQSWMGAAWNDCLFVDVQGDG